MSYGGEPKPMEQRMQYDMIISNPLWWVAKQNKRVHPSK